ncbi:NUDIX hydrolase [Vibrio sinensis]|uniref:GDP-mannose pyrophosphatase n=1 Tax=Vibrio sinensis TaxID=2302434 RepID=A0A3A6R397_9VIBR|nr:NUDIX hydrolase [Vibrio sinensis]RJX71369.1 NUDIX hydrolase [Vibrio sinensis]
MTNKPASKVLHTWKRISLVEETIQLPNGKEIIHTTIAHPGAAVILPIDQDGNVILINQYRPSLKKWLLELPAGTIEHDEAIEHCAQRELEEETGYFAHEMISLGQVTPLAGFCDEIQYLFVAKDLTRPSRYTCDDDEIIEVVTLTIHQLEQLIITGEISDAKTIACLSKAKLCGYI